MFGCQNCHYLEDFAKRYIGSFAGWHQSSQNAQSPVCSPQASSKSKSKLSIQSLSFQVDEPLRKQEASTEATTPRQDCAIESDSEQNFGVRVKGETCVPSYYLFFEDSQTIYQQPKTMSPPLTLKLGNPSWG